MSVNRYNLKQECENEQDLTKVYFNLTERVDYIRG